MDNLVGQLLPVAEDSEGEERQDLAILLGTVRHKKAQATKVMAAMPTEANHQAPVLQPCVEQEAVSNYDKPVLRDTTNRLSELGTDQHEQGSGSKRAGKEQVMSKQPVQGGAEVAEVRQPSKSRQAPCTNNLQLAYLLVGRRT